MAQEQQLQQGNTISYVKSPGFSCFSINQLIRVGSLCFTYSLNPLFTVALHGFT